MEDEKEVQFYFVRFGECCEKNESYIKYVIFFLNDKDFKVNVCCFRVLGIKEINILYFLVFFNKFDYDVNQFFSKFLFDVFE